MTHGTTLYKRTADPWRMPRDDTARVRSLYNTVMDRWGTTIIPNLRRNCTGRLNPRAQQVEVRCR